MRDDSRRTRESLLELLAALGGLSLVGAILLTAPTWGAWIDRIAECR